MGRQWRHAVHSLSWRKSWGGVSSSATDGQSSTEMTSLLASLASNIASNSSVDRARMSYRRGQSGTLCPELPQQKQVRESGFLLWFASMSIGTGCPGVGLTCACVGRGRGADWMGVRRLLERGTEVRWADQKASLEALFWSMFLAALYHTVGAMLEGHPFVIVATTFCICGSKPLLNLTTNIFGSV